MFGTAFEGHAKVHRGWEFKQSKHWGWETQGVGDNVRARRPAAHSLPSQSFRQPCFHF